MLKDFLVGAQLKKLDDNGFTVVKNNKEYHFKFDRDEGDCCGYTEIETRLYVSNSELKNNPIITKVTQKENDDGEEDLGVITLYGEYKPIGEIIAQTSSGSGWCYGATVSVRCELAGVDEIISQY